MEIITIIIFLVTLWGFGATVAALVKESDNKAERHIMRLALGLAVYTVLATLFTITKVPLNWWLFFMLAVIYPLYWLSVNYKTISQPSFSFKLQKSHLYLLVLIILFMFTLSMYHKGAFSYDYYEDGDPWRHGGAVRYIALEKTALEPVPLEVANPDTTSKYYPMGLFQYIDAYPPAYDSILAMAYQTSGDIIWTLKFFNLLLISLSILFFYYAVQQLTGKRGYALFATTVLAFLPAYMSHFIWALSLAMVLFFPLVYAALKIEDDRRWWTIAAIAIAALLLSQPSQSVNLLVMFGILIVAKMALTKSNIKEYILGCVLGGLLAFFIWWLPMLLKYGSFRLMVGAIGTNLQGAQIAGKIGLKGTADRIYTFNDFFIAKAQNMINNPIGLGVIITIVVGISIIYLLIRYKSLLEKENHWQIIAAAWLVFALIGVNGARLPVQFWAFRFWMILAVAVSLFACIGAFNLSEQLKRYGIPAAITFLVIIAGIWFTSGQQKYDLNTNQWVNPNYGAYPSGEFAEDGQWQSWEFITGLPKDTKIFYPCHNNKIGDPAILALDKYTCMWCQDEIMFKRAFLQKSPEETAAFLNTRNYEYLFVDAKCAKGKNATEFAEETNTIIVSIAQNPSFSIAHQSQGGILFKLI